MYLKHFGLRKYPFGLTPNTRFFYALPSHQEALNVLQVALFTGEGFIKITGEVGTGKTMLCRKFLNELDDPFVAAYIPNPALTRAELMAELAREMGLQVRESNTECLLIEVNRRLLDLAAKDKRLVLVLDEAQAIPRETLELLRLLTNLETESQKLLQIVLFGQPELDDLLAQSEMRQLRQRIAFSHRIKPLDYRQTREFVRHRLEVAGYAGEDLFTGPAYCLLHFHGLGTPRLINVLAHKALMAAYGQGCFLVHASHVRAAHLDGLYQRSARTRWAWWLLVLAGLSALVWAGGAWR